MIFFLKVIDVILFHYSFFNKIFTLGEKFRISVLNFYSLSFGLISKQLYAFTTFKYVRSL